jgi:hypothetical protein
MKRKYYNSPRILKKVEVLLERDFLGSVMTGDTNVVSAGQQTETLDISGPSFNHTWGEQ